MKLNMCDTKTEAAMKTSKDVSGVEQMQDEMLGQATVAPKEGTKSGKKTATMPGTTTDEEKGMLSCTI